MFRTKDPVTLYLFNFVFGCFLFWLCQMLGWFRLPANIPLWQVVLVAGIVNVISRFAVQIFKALTAWIWVPIACCTLGISQIGVNAFSIFAVLWLTAYWSGLFTITNPFFSWESFWIGIFFGLLRYRLDTDK